MGFSKTDVALPDEDLGLVTSIDNVDPQTLAYAKKIEQEYVSISQNKVGVRSVILRALKLRMAMIILLLANGSYDPKTGKRTTRLVARIMRDMLLKLGFNVTKYICDEGIQNLVFVKA